MILARKPLIPALAFLLIVGYGIWVLPQMAVYSNPLHYFKRNSGIRKNLESIESKMGSSQQLIGEFRRDGEIWEQDYMSSIYAIERELEKLPGIMQVFSIVDIIKSLYEIRTGQTGFPSKAIARFLYGNLSSVENFVQDDGIIFYAVSSDWDTESTAKILAFSAEHKVINSVTGTPILYARLNELVTETQRVTLLFTLVGLIAVLAIVFRKPAAVSISLIPLAITIAGTYGLLYLTGFSLNMLTATLTAVVIGVGIDYVIHLIFLIQYFKREGDKDYTTKALEFSGVPIITNAFAIVCGVLPLFFSPLRVHLQVAVVMGFAMALSSLSTLIIIPLFFRKGLGKANEAGTPRIDTAK